MATKIIILAAGQGSRMKADKPKVLHTLGGKKILSRIISVTEGIQPKSILLIHGHQSDRLQSEINPKHSVSWVFQAEQLGTAHAVQQAISGITPEDSVLILTGDVPLIEESTLRALEVIVNNGFFGIATVNLDDPQGYGRIKRDNKANIIGIVEQKDASVEELEITEINTGIMAIPGNFLLESLPKIQNQNAQKEYYLTDIIELAVDAGLPIKAVKVVDSMQVEGVNDKIQLASLERRYQAKLAHEHMKNGLMLLDPNRFDLRGELIFGVDCEVDANVIFEGKNTIGNNCKIGANCILKNVTLEDNVVIEPMSLLEDVVVRKNAVIGPFARLRPGADIGENAKVGNFVEVKKSLVGKGSKINHLSYIGDANIGENVNVGAGTITCNYDGVNKFVTEIEDGAFIGSNSSLVAPVKIGENSVVGAGSTIAKDTPANKLSLTRAKQLVIDKWKRPIKK